MIKVKNLSKKFEDKIIFKDLNITFETGDCIAIIGKSGCGKTTLLNMLGLIDTIYEGNIECDGVSFRSLKNNAKQKFIRNNINYLFQNYALIDDTTVYKNLEFALYYEKISKKKKHNKIMEALHSVGLEDYGEKKIYTLSGGEQQRIALARAMIKKGNIILADEPTGNLDEENREIVLQNLLELNKQGKTVIIVTHDPYVASKCNSIVKLK